MASQEESVREFVAVTDVDEERARFFLESAGWNLQVRLSYVFPDSPGEAYDVRTNGKAVKMTRVRGIANRLTLACVAGNLCKSPFDNGLGALCRRQKGLLCGYLVDAVTVIKTQLCNFTTYVTVKVSAN